MTTKRKTLHIKLSMDVSNASDAMINALSAFWVATFAECGVVPSFHVEEHEDHEGSIERMLQLVRSEFAAYDASQADTAESEEGVEVVVLDEKRSQVFNDFLSGGEGV